MPEASSELVPRPGHQPAAPTSVDRGGGRGHDAFVYRTTGEYVAFVCAFVREGLATGDRVLVAVPGDRLATLRSALPEAEGLVRYADSTGSGDDPMRTFQLWRDFLDEGDGAPCRGVGEPGLGRRDGDGPDHHLHHEHILRAASGPGHLRLLCAYDAAALPDEVLHHARASHATVYEPDAPAPGRTGPTSRDDLPTGGPAPEGPAVPELRFGRNGLGLLRKFVEHAATGAGLGPERTADLVLAANEIATNAVIHGGSGGTARCRLEDGDLVCELDGAGTITDPLAGSVRPDPGCASGRGLWLASQLCDRIEITNTADGNVVRLHVRTADVGSA